MSFSGGGNSSTSQQVQPYAAAEPALGQILSEASNIYSQGPTAAGFVAPTTQTMEGLAGQEALARQSQQQLADTLSGNFTNPFLQPLIQRVGSDIATTVNQQFTGAGRTPGSPLNQQQIATQVAQAALPLAFQQFNTERARQLALASRLPTLFQTGQQLEGLQRQQQLAPAQALQQYQQFVSPIASGFPVSFAAQNTQANPFSTALGGALLGSQFGGQGALIGGGLGLLGGLL
tara:strand:- start:65 stop:763 length:699 start_codon:yes stop_codon:yes gene_type:complete